ncbi:uncharacterized protein LOC116605656 isoform X1 [Nematostella vectensis]|uniref:uncharacterized protein LOC5507457 isoform X1 n=1 Tax=Nematostella vectensis TaxID=45351 RepID=UPI0020773FC7|nr:uncharacterized protein LOC5507457 isoform X1 [Nematostella vectensis]XP_048582226.1 uncharacterized protein LOC116605656 isoform X1 [Nematostella vectensis]
MAPKSRGKRKKSVEELLKEGRDLLDRQEVKSKRKRKPVRFLFSTDPATGLRNNKGTYKGQKKSKEKRLNPEFDVSGEGGYYENEVHHEDNIAEEGVTRLDLKAIKDIVEEWCSKNKKPKQCWTDRQEQLHESWAETRPSLFAAALSARFSPPESDICQVCTVNKVSIRCLMCKEGLLCGPCDQERHADAPFHDRDILIDGHYEALPNYVSKSALGEWIDVIQALPPNSPIHCPGCRGICDPSAPLPGTHLIVVNLNGRYDLLHRSFKCNGCNELFSTSHPLVLIQLGYWPGSVTSVTYGFDQRLLSYWDILQKQIPGISEHAFLKSLELHSQLYGRIPTINASTFRTSFQEWKYLQFEINSICHMDWMQCPACSDDQHSVHVDGNMKLYRFKSAGSRKKECYYGEAFIASNNKVDEHIKNIYHGAKHKDIGGGSMCGESNWRAAGNNLKKKKNLSETGLEIAACRHGLAQNAINMMYGEIYGYAHYLQLNHFIPKGVKFLWYDVVCLYWPWLRRNENEASKKMKPALSVMHAKAHAWHCQAIWGGRWQTGAAATTGEETEQVNSHFSRLGSTTKHMLPEGREELLTEHALEWNRRKIVGMPSYLARKYKRVEKQFTTLNAEIDKEFVEINFGRDCAKEWKEEILRVAKVEQCSLQSRKSKITDAERRYLVQIMGKEPKTDYEKALLSVSKEIYGEKAKDCSGGVTLSAEKGMLEENAVLYLRKQMEQMHFSIAQAVYNMGKLTDTSKQRKKLRTKVTSWKQTLKTAVDRHNAINPSSIVKEDDVEEGLFAWSQTECQDCVSLRTKRRLVNKVMEAERFGEELVLLKREMVSFLKFYKDVKLPSLREEQTRLQDLMNAGGESSLSHDDKGCRYLSAATHTISAKLALVMNGIAFAMRQLTAGTGAFAQILSTDLEEFRQFLLMSEVDVREDEDDEDQPDDGDDTVEPESSACSTRVVLEALSSLHNGPTPSVSPDALTASVWRWSLPPTLSQGTFNGRNGSNACSVIALCLGYALQEGLLLPPDVNKSLSETFLGRLCGCIELGNRIYDLFRQSLPSRFLSIQEAANIAVSWISSDVGQPLPVRLADLHEPSTVTYQLKRAFSRGGFNACLIADEKSSLFHACDDLVIHIDTHSHGPNKGAVVTAAHASAIPELCSTVWQEEGFSPNSFGNLVFVEFA